MNKLKLEDKSKFLETFGTSNEGNFSVVGKDTFVAQQTLENHIYMITPKHLEWNPDPMYLGNEQIEQMEKEHGPMCGQRFHAFRGSHQIVKCNMYQKDHHYKTDESVAYIIECKRPISDDGKTYCKELLTFLRKVKKIGKMNKSMGFAMIDTKGKGASVS